MESPTWGSSLEKIWLITTAWTHSKLGHQNTNTDRTGWLRRTLHCFVPWTTTYAQVAHSQIKSNEFKSNQSNHFILLNGLLSFLQCNSVATMSPDPVLCTYSHGGHVLPLLAHSSTNVPYYGQTPTHVCKTSHSSAFKQVRPSFVRLQRARFHLRTS